MPPHTGSAKYDASLVVMIAPCLPRRSVCSLLRAADPEGEAACAGDLAAILRATLICCGPHLGGLRESNLGCSFSRLMEQQLVASASGALPLSLPACLPFPLSAHLRQRPPPFEHVHRTWNRGEVGGGARSVEGTAVGCDVDTGGCGASL